MEKKTNTQELTLVEILRPLAQLLIRFMGPDQRQWLEAFKRFLRKEHPWISTRWKVWTMARMGTKKSVDELIAAVTEQGFMIRTNDVSPIDLRLIKEHLKFNDIEEDVYFAAVSPKELGLKPGWTRRQLIDSAIKQGLCPILSGDMFEIIAQGRCKLKEHDSFGTGMEPILINKSWGFGKWSDGCGIGYNNGNLTTKFNYPDNVNNKHIFRIKNVFS